MACILDIFPVHEYKVSIGWQSSFYTSSVTYDLYFISSCLLGAVKLLFKKQVNLHAHLKGVTESGSEFPEVMSVYIMFYKVIS